MTTFYDVPLNDNNFFAIDDDFIPYSVPESAVFPDPGIDVAIGVAVGEVEEATLTTTVAAEALLAATPVGWVAAGVAAAIGAGYFALEYISGSGGGSTMGRGRVAVTPAPSPVTQPPTVYNPYSGTPDCRIIYTHDLNIPTLSQWLRPSNVNNNLNLSRRQANRFQKVVSLQRDRNNRLLAL